MSLRSCIDEALAAGDIDEARAARIRQILDEEEAGLAGEMDGPAAEAEAGRRAFARLEGEARERERRTRLQMSAGDAIRERILTRRDPAKNGEGRANPYAELPDLIEHHGTSPNPSVMGRYRAILGRAHGMMADIIFRFERDVFTRTRNKAELIDVARELHGTDSGNAAARELAEGWRGASEWLRQRFNAAGGDIRRLDNWGFPHIWDDARIGRAGFEAWRDAIRPELDRARMVNNATGRPLDDAALDALLREVFDGIVTGGWRKREPVMRRSGMGRSVARRHQEHRVLVFRDGDAWMRAHDAFGRGTPFSAMMGYLDRMSRETAAMEILGPDPDAMLGYAAQVADKAVAQANEPGRRPRRRWTRRMEDMWNLFIRTRMAGADSDFSRWLGTAYNLKVASQLGGAAISALTDAGFQRVARKMSGLPEARILHQTLRTMDPTNDAHRRLAVRSGLIAEGAAQLMAGQTRYVNEFGGAEISERLADFTLRASGLSPLTQARRWSFGMELMGFFADMSDTAFADLPQMLRENFARYGISPDDWDDIRSSAAYEHEGGARFLRPEEISENARLGPARADDLAMRLHEMISMETDYAVPAATLRARAMIIGSVRGVPILEAVARSVSMYRSFSVSVMLLYGGRSWQTAAQYAVLRGAVLAAKTAIYGALLGALVLQTKEILKGRDPRPMFGDREEMAKFWGAAMLQGGGLGIFGDLLFSDQTRFSTSLGGVVAGPLGEEAGRIADMTVLDAGRALFTDEETHTGRDAVDFLRRNTPGGSIWYLRLAYERLLLDQLQEMADPEATDRFRRLERRYQREYGQGYWWAPGEAMPSRAPDPANVMGPPE